jgi:hypothetical protein
MARIDRLREEIGWLKLVFGVLAAIDASLLGWLAQDFTTASWPLVWAGSAAAAVIGVVVAHVNRLAYRRIEELENA